VTDSPSGSRVEVLTEDEWPRLQSIRLTALGEDPSAFLNSHKDEEVFGEQEWRQEFSRGKWYILVSDDKEIGLLGVTRDGTGSEQKHYLEYLWINPGLRRGGMASTLLRRALVDLQASGVHAVWLYILDGNNPAMRLYQKFGFEKTDERVMLPDHPAGGEDLLKLLLDKPASSYS
jgi:ribosomal protein S18 acetylase RimI-like enzyme